MKHYRAAFTLTSTDEKGNEKEVFLGFVRFWYFDNCKITPAAKAFRLAPREYQDANKLELEVLP